MTGKARVINTLEFKGTDRIPLDMWVLPAAQQRYGKKLDELRERYMTDIVSLVGPFDHGFTPAYYTPGKFTDPWGSEWTNIQAGVIGEVKKPVFEDYEKLDAYRAPVDRFLKEWNENKAAIAQKAEAAHKKGRFVIGGWISIFERLQFLRGTENVYCDIALKEPDLFRMIDVVMEYMRVYVTEWLKMDIDAMPFGDDWGSQISLLISPNTWIRIFKPLYKELIDQIHAAGKKVFFHSDGYIFDLYPQFIDMGVDAVNSQLWCMGVEKIAERFAGKITFWGEISRQDTLPNGMPADVVEAARVMKHLFHMNGGGLIGQSEINRDVPFDNIVSFCRAWNEVK